MNKRKILSENIKCLTLGAVMSALGFVVLYLGAVIDILDLSMAIIASMLCTFIVIETSGAWPWLVYSVTGLLSLLLLPNRFPAVLYLAFAGNYPILKEKLEKLKPIPQWLLKFVVFNIELTLTFVISKYVFLIPDDYIGFTVNLIVYVICNLVFVLYDITLTKLVGFYLFRIKKKLRIK